MALASVASAAISLQSAHAAPEFVSMKPVSKLGQKVEGNDWYYIRVRCLSLKHKRKYPSNSRRTMALRIDHTDNPEEPSQFPSDQSATGLVTIYAAKTRNTPAIYPSGACNKLYMVKGEDNPSVTVFATQRRIEWEKYADQALAVVGAIVTLYSPFYKSIKFKEPKSGRTVSLEGSAEATTQVQAVVKAVSALSKDNGNQRDHERLSGRNMREGLYRFTTDYADLEVTIGKYDSMLIGPGKFREAISKIVANPTMDNGEIFDVTEWEQKDFRQSCQTLKANLDEVGIKNKVDQGYVFFYFFLLANGGDPKMVASCMGESMARLYAEQPDKDGKKQPKPWRLLHERIPSALPITSDIIDGIFGEKPVNKFNVIAHSVAGVAQETAVRGKPGTLASSVYKKRSKEVITFVDLTGRVLENDDVENTTLGEAIVKMGKAGFKRYGYVALLPDDYEYPLDDTYKTRATMLAFQQEPGEQLYRNSAILMRLFFDEQKISGIILSQGEALNAAFRNDRAKEIPIKGGQQNASANDAQQKVPAS
ncbi:hypothetical protein [uncultured Roseibium sp.]|uniref:hypothetical protein n=1 Tax=uncultured Roseibium sp. TaxID=1936171 RepID=UPI003216E731